MSAEPVRVRRHSSALGSWQALYAAPSPALAPYVRSLCGFRERTPEALVRREMPAPQTVIIVDLGPPLWLLDACGAERARHPSGFVAGLSETFTLTRTAGELTCIQIDLTPLGGYRLLGIPMSSLRGAAVGLAELFGAPAARLVERLQETRDWMARLAQVDAFLAERVERGRAADAWVVWAHDRILRAGGMVEIGQLAKELGYSRKHVNARFLDQLGLAPKRFAQLVRFDRAMARIKAGAIRTWTELAVIPATSIRRISSENFAGTPG